MEIERRTLKVELRSETGGEKPIMRGMAAMFNSSSEDLGGFREIIAPGAFRDAIGVSDIRALFNHDSNMILGRTASGTLRVMETDEGLAFELDPPDTTYARDLAVSMERGDISQCSFGFSVEEGGDTWEKDSCGTKWVRTINKVGRLYDVSPVTYPAYPETKCALRSLEKAQEAVKPPVFDDTELRKLKVETESEAGWLPKHG